MMAVFFAFTRVWLPVCCSLICCLFVIFLFSTFFFFYLTAETDHRAPDEYLALVMRYSTMSWWPPKAAMCKALHPSLLASRISAPNFTSSFTSSRLPSMTDWWRAVCPSGPKELTLNSQFVMFCSKECSSLVLPFFTASWKTLCGAEQVDTSAWLMVAACGRLREQVILPWL